jgi:rhamnosyltransferase
MIAAVIVLYYPDLPLLERLFESLAGQIDFTIVVDNTPSPSTECSEFLKAYGNRIFYTSFGDNMGIATAQNAGIRKGISEGCSHVLLLDQDSSLAPGMVNTLLSTEEQLLAVGKQVASVGPLFVDEKTQKPSFAVRPGRVRVKRLPLTRHSPEPVESDYLIASGSLTRSVVYRTIGLMRDELFIDWVDIEWGLRARSEGFISYIAPNAIMAHSIGDAAVRFLGVDILLHSDTRNYYMIRNATYLLRLKSLRNWRLITSFKVLMYVVFYSLYSRHRWKTSNLLIRAVIHGLRGRLGRIDRPSIASASSKHSLDQPPRPPE